MDARHCKDNLLTTGDCFATDTRSDIRLSFLPKEPCNNNFRFSRGTVGAKATFSVLGNHFDRLNAQPSGWHPQVG